MLRLLSLTLGLLLITVLVLVVIVIDAAPLVEKAPPPTAAEQRQLARLFEADPGAESMTIALRGRELAVLTDAALPRVLERAMPGRDHADARARIVLGAGRADLTLSVPLGGAGRWLNVRAALLQTDGLPIPRAVSIGGLRLPGVVAQWLFGPVLQSAAALGVVQQVAMTPEQLQVRIGAAGDGELSRLRSAQTNLAGVLARPPKGTREMGPLLAAVLAKAAIEPVDAADPVAANRATILALAGYVLTGRLPASVDANHRYDRRKVKLLGREDLAKHWLASAALTVGGTSGFSSLVGLAKELDDAERGSGFSFADLAANRAGIRFARLATADPASALKLQGFARAGFSDADLAPTIDGLPEGIGQRRFDLDYGGGYGTAYTQLVEHIDRRIDGLPLYRTGRTIGAGQ